MSGEKDKKQLGRPTEMTPEKILLLEQAFSMGCSDLEACLHADIGKTTLYNFQQKHPEFVERKEKLKEKLILKSRTVIADALNKKDENTAKWYLERKKKDEFGTRTELTGVSGSPIVISQEFDFDKLKQLREMIDKE